MKLKWPRRSRDRTAGAPSAQYPAPAVTGVFDAGATHALEVDGYVHLPPLLDSTQCQHLRDVFAEVRQRLGRPLGEEWFPTILVPDPELRRFITEEVGGVVLPQLESIVDLSVLEPVRVDYSVKPPGPRSLLGPHQDFSIVDERRWTSLYLWVPLVDTDEHNGTLHVLPGSHRFTNRVRSRYVPSVFDPVLDEVERASTRLDCRAGDLVLMTSGVVHFSHSNATDDLRLAAHGVLKPIEAPMIYYYADDQTPPGQAEMYEVQVDEYIELTLQGRPGPEVPFAGYCERPPAAMSPERFRAGMTALGAVQLQ